MDGQPPQSVPNLLVCYYWTNKHIAQLEMMRGSHYGQDWLLWGSDSKSGRRFIRICHVPIRHFCHIHQESCAFLITAPRMTTRFKEMNVRGNNGESGRNKFMEQRPNLELLPHESQSRPELLLRINFSCTVLFFVQWVEGSKNGTLDHRASKTSRF